MVVSTQWGVCKGGFIASPIVAHNTVFIGSTDGHFYALDAATGKSKWQYPKTSDPPLLGSCRYGQYGIASSASYAHIGGQDAVIFGAPDPTAIDPAAKEGFGSAALFAFDLSGNPIWKSEPVAQVSGCTPGSLSEHHERIAYSSPLVLGDKVYVGIHDHADDPIQKGKVVAVDLNSGHIERNFQFVSVGALGDMTRGGGVWNSPATDGLSVYFTTGNTRTDSASPNGQSPEPSPNHGLSMIRVDKDTGNIVWPFQPVPYDLDQDPDWAAGAAVMSTSCGELIASVQKDGWSYAVDATSGACRWQFPPDPQLHPTPSCTWTGYSRFDPNDPKENGMHGGEGYKAPGAAWNDVFVVRTAGENLMPDTLAAGYLELHALNACAKTEKDRVRWIAANIANSAGCANLDGGCENALGAPTVTGGIVFIGTYDGQLVVLGDPSIVPGIGYQCSNIDYTTPSSCMAAGYALVPIPKMLANVRIPDGGDIAHFRSEAALAKGRVFVATGGGHVYMLDTAVEINLAECLACCKETTSQCLAGCFPNPPHSGCAPPGLCRQKGENCQASCGQSGKCIFQ